ncbi:MAG: beta-ketoacyl-ACP synthase III [Microcystaceae cyanobacterium]
MNTSRREKTGLHQITMGITFTGCGAAIAPQSLSNGELGKLVETSDEWIQTRTGIKERTLCPPEQSLAQLAAQAGEKAIAMAGLTPTDLDLILLATSTPDDLFGTAPQVQGLLGATRAVAFDVTAVCSGFVFAVITAAQFMRSGLYRRVLVIGGDILSRWVDWSDRTTCVLFGDGAGAVVLEANPTQDQLLAFDLYTDGTLNSALNLSFQGERRSLLEDKAVSQGTYQPITMNGREVYRFAVAKVPEVIEKVLFQADLPVTAIDWLILHQANQRIMEAVAERLGIPPEKVVSHLDKYGNTSAASIPLALDAAVRSGQIQPGDLIATSGFGAGLSWGAALFRWGRSISSP